MSGGNFASLRRGTWCDCFFVIAVDAWGVGVGGASETSGCGPLGKLGGLEMFGQGIHRWPRTSSEEYKVECPIVCPQSRIRRWSAVANMGSIGRRESDQQQVWKWRGNLLRHVGGLDCKEFRQFRSCFHFRVQNSKKMSDQSLKLKS